MKRPYSVAQGYAEDDLDSYMFVPDKNRLFVLVGDQGGEIYISIESEQSVYQDVVISYEAASQIRDYLDEILK